MTYQRVIPRDFFNEAKLLKCLGQLSLKILDNDVPEGIKIEIDHYGEPFDISLMDEGSLCVMNHSISINEYPVIFKTTYNSKEAYPFYCECDGEDFLVFNNIGEFTEEFINQFKSL